MASQEAWDGKRSHAAGANELLIDGWDRPVLLPFKLRAVELQLARVMLRGMRQNGSLHVIRNHSEHTGAPCDNFGAL